MNKVIAVLASSPKEEAALQVEKEVLIIKEQLEGTDYSVIHRRNATSSDFRSLMFEKPKILHFSGHGHGHKGISLQTKEGKAHTAETRALTRLFELFTNEIECVVLNTCHSKVQAKSIIPYVSYVIGMNDEIADDSALRFTEVFYEALAQGMRIIQCFYTACNSFDLDYPRNIDYNIPVLYIREGKSHKELLYSSEYEPENISETTKDLDNKVKRVISEPILEKFEKNIGIFRMKVSDKRQTCLAIKGSNFYTSGFDNEIHIINYETHEKKTVSTPDKKIIRALSVYQDTVLFSGESGRLYALDTESTEIIELLSLQKEVFCIFCAISQQSVFVGIADGRVSRINLRVKENKIVEAQLGESVIQHQESKIFSISYDDYQKLLYAAGTKGLLTKRYNSGRIKTFNIESDNIFSIAVSDQVQALASSDGLIHISKDDFETVVKKWMGHSSAVRSLCLSKMSKWLASGSKDKCVKLWDISTGLSINLLETRDYVYQVLFDTNSRILGVVDGAGDLTWINFGEKVDGIEYAVLNDKFVEFFGF